MTGRTHDVAALTALLAVFSYAPSLPPMTMATLITALGANFVGGLFPDIDQPTSDLWDNFRFGPLVAKVICSALGGHRHLSHSLVGLVVIAGGTWMVLGVTLSYVLLPIDRTIVWLAFMIGVVSHLVTDFVTREGLPLFWPLKWKIGFPPFRWMRMETGSWVERRLLLPGLLMAAAFLLYSHQERLLLFIHQYVK